MNKPIEFLTYNDALEFCSDSHIGTESITYNGYSYLVNTEITKTTVFIIDYHIMKNIGTKQEYVQSVYREEVYATNEEVAKAEIKKKLRGMDTRYSPKFVNLISKRV